MVALNNCAAAVPLNLSPVPEHPMRPLPRAFGTFLMVGGLSTLLQYLILTIVELCRADGIWPPAWALP